MLANYYSVKSDYSAITIKFAYLPKAASISNDNFLLFENAATPVVTPFQTINMQYDYSSIGRLLILRFANSLKSHTSYRLTVSGILDIIGAPIAPENFDFTTEFVTAAYGEDVVRPQNSPVEIKDRSIQSRAFLTSETIR